jgi:hypothetical protein
LPEIALEIEVRVESRNTPLPAVDYRWDEDTDILTATLRVVAKSDGMSGSVEVQGSDGSWLIFDVNAGQIAGIEVAVWPDVRKTAMLAAPADVSPVTVRVPTRRSQPGVASVEVDTRLTAEADTLEQTIHFRFGGGRMHRVVRLAQDLMFDLDDGDRVVGVWLLNVPPFPVVQ